jgi:DNA-binding Xre family transcriptional regulator
MLCTKINQLVWIYLYLERICEALDCEPGELLERGPKEEEAK